MSPDKAFEQILAAAQELGYEIGIMEGESPVHQGMAIGTKEFVDCVLDKRPHERWTPPINVHQHGSGE